MELETILINSGLESKEAKVYLSCLQLGQETAFNIAKKSELKRPTVYVILNSLAEKGLVTVIKTQKATLYSPIHPQRLISSLKRKEQALEKALPDLETIYNVRPQKPKIQILEGKTGIASIYGEIIESLKKSKEILSFGSLSHFQTGYQDLLKNWFRETKNKKYKVREIINQEKFDLDYIQLIQKNKNPNHQIKIMPKNEGFVNNDNFIYENKIAIFSVQKDLFVILIESKDLADSYRRLFNLAWHSAKEMK